LCRRRGAATNEELASIVKREAAVAASEGVDEIEDLGDFLEELREYVQDQAA